MSSSERSPCVEASGFGPDAAPRGPRLACLDGLRGLTSLYIALMHLR